MPTHLIVSFIFFSSSIGIMASATVFYAPLWMEAKGITPEKWGIISSVAMIGKIFFVIFICERSDKYGSRKPFIAWNAIIATLLIFVFYWANDSIAISIIWFLVFLLAGSLIPLSDALLLTSLNHDSKVSYNVMRSFTSLAYMFLGFFGGWFLQNYGIEQWPLLGSLSMMLVVICVMFLPNSHTPETTSKSPWLATLKLPWIKPFILVASLVSASHIVLNIFGVIFWKALGFQESDFGFFIGISIISEIAIFFIYRRFTSKIRPTLALLISALFAALRWALMANATSFWEIMLIQTFHGFTFGITHSAVIEFLRINVPAQLRSSGQAVYDVLAITAAPAIAAPVIGFIYQTSPQYALYAVSLLALLAVLPASYILYCKPHHGV